MPPSCTLLGGFAIGLRCYGNITRTRNVSQYMLVLTLCLVVLVVDCVADKLLMCNSFPSIQIDVLTVANFLML